MKNIIKYTGTHDLIFNKLMHNHPDILADLFNSLELSVKIDDYHDIEYTKQRMDGGVEFKTSIMDVKFKVLDKLFVDMEMQNKNDQNYFMINRLEHYAASLRVEATKRAENYNNKLCVVIGFLNYKEYDDNHCMRIFKMTDEYGNIRNNTMIILIELTKLNYCDKKRLREWLLLLKSKDLKIYESGDDIMKKAANVIESMNENEAILREIDLLEKERYHIGEVKRAAKEEGLKEGIAQGIAQGISQEKLETAKKLKKHGIPLKTIIEITGLTEEVILNL